MVAAAVEGELGSPPPPETAAFRRKRGSVFPAKRKLVKTMMLELIVESLLSCFGRVHLNRTFQKKNKKKTSHHTSLRTRRDQDMEKKVVSRFYHEHPLILTENVNDEDSPNYCYGCYKPVANTEMVYTCMQQRCRNRYFRHKKCGELPNQICHPQHSKHPLHLFYFNKLKDDGGDGDDDGGFDRCDLCEFPIRKVLGYRCPDCNFNVGVQCAEASIEERKELQHPSHPHHPLTLFRKPRFSFHCDGCGDEDVDTAYVCSTCEFWLHKRCASSLPAVLPVGEGCHHHHHPLSLIFSLPEKHIEYRYRCDVCSKYCDASRWSYFCGECRYIVHIKCAIRSSTAKPDVSNLNEDGGYVIEFPLHANDISHKLIKPFVMREKGQIDTVSTSSSTSTNTSYLLEYYHEHPLRYVSEFTRRDDGNDEEKDDEEESKICDVCVTPISNSSTPYYECATSTCTYSIHSICSLLPHTLQHSSSSSNTKSSLPFLGECGGITSKKHNFTLYRSKGGYSIMRWACDLCGLPTNGMGYECGDCGKKIDVKCASLPTTIRHASHTHRHHKPLTLTSIPSLSYDDARRKLCHGCNRTFDDYNRRLAYFCKVDGCDFGLHLRCAVLPSSVTNRELDKHPLLLMTSDASLDHPSDFFCEFCEEEMHPKNWMYHCRHCDASFHLNCLDTGSGPYRNMKLGGRYEFEGIHPKHTLTFTCVTLKKHCDLCHKREYVYTWLGFECATCYYVLCGGCGLAEFRKKLS